MKQPAICSYFVLLLVILAGCDKPVDQSADLSKSGINAPEAEAIELPEEITIDELRTKLKANQYAQFRKQGGQIVFADLRDSGVTDLTPLAGLPLMDLMLENLQIKDLSPLKGMNLNQLYLNDSAIEDISPLANVQAKLLNLNGTKIKDISSLANMKLDTLWIPHTQVTDISPLAKQEAMISLDCEESPVTDIAPLANVLSLQRLNIAKTQVTDLTPLAKHNLTRLIFSPEKIKTGIDIARNMTSIQEIGSNLDQKMTPDVFWKLFDETQAASQNKTDPSDTTKLTEQSKTESPKTEPVPAVEK
jgi:hypothetical protein